MAQNVMATVAKEVEWVECEEFWSNLAEGELPKLARRLPEFSVAQLEDALIQSRKRAGCLIEREEECCRKLRELQFENTFLRGTCPQQPPVVPEMPVSLRHAPVLRTAPVVRANKTLPGVPFFKAYHGRVPDDKVDSVDVQETEDYQLKGLYFPPQDPSTRKPPSPPPPPAHSEKTPPVPSRVRARPDPPRPPCPEDSKRQRRMWRKNCAALERDMGIKR